MRPNFSELKYNGGAELAVLKEENIEALEKGFCNLQKLCFLHK